MNDYVKNFITIADEDLETAKVLNEKENPITRSICFHCQQSVEKFLKAYLAQKNIDFEKTHKLEEILDLCKEHDISFEDIEVGDLSSYAVEIRYPDDFYIPAIDEAKESIKIADTVKDFVMKKLNNEENNNHGKNGSPENPDAPERKPAQE